MTLTPHARELVGAAVRRARNRRSLSIESAAKAGGVGHMTWRKIEHGKSVHDQSYYAVDRAFGWTTGHTLAAFDVDDPTDRLEPESTDVPVPEPSKQHTPVTAANPHTPHATPVIREDEHRFDHVLAELPSLTLSELKSVNTAAERIIEERAGWLNEIRGVVESTEENLPQVNEWLLHHSDSATSEYHMSYARYVHMWIQLENMKTRLQEYEYKWPVTPDQLENIYTEARDISVSLTTAADDLRRVEHETLERVELSEHEKERN